MPASKRRRFAVAGATLTLALTAAMSGYTVERGDTLSGIAAQHGVTTADLASANGITNPDRIYVGQHLTIPGSGSTSPTATTYVVESGDTLASIARRLGTTVEAIAAANGITNPNLVYVGTQLTISDAPITPSTAPGSGGSGTHTVTAGETLSGIAARYGTTAAQLASANGLGDPNKIRSGQVLEVPGSRGFVCPVPGGDFFNDWGFPRSGGRYHVGTDLFAPRGTPVLAPVSGYVHQIVGTIGGIQFRLEGNDGHRYIGTHMDSFGKGGEVRAGEVIGYVGDSGNARGSRPHLHFEIILDRATNTNPYPYLQEACR